jgi:hypothetical protein
VSRVDTTARETARCHLVSASSSLCAQTDLVNAPPACPNHAASRRCIRTKSVLVTRVPLRGMGPLRARLSVLEVRGGFSFEMAEVGGSAIWMRSRLDTLDIQSGVQPASAWVPPTRSRKRRHMRVSKLRVGDGTAI